MRRVVLDLVNRQLTEEERLKTPKERLEIYSKRLEALLSQPHAETEGEALPPENQRNHIVQFELGPEIFVVAQEVWDALVRELVSAPHRLKTIDRRGFEELVAFLFEGFGYEVELTKRTRDGGRDVIAVRRAEIHTKYLIECKRPDPGTAVGVRPVRELYGVKHDEGATKAVLATTTYFTRDALLFMERHRWELEPRDYEGVLDWITQYLGEKRSP